MADIYLDGTLVLPTFQPERSTDPLPIPAGDHVVEIRTAGAASTETPLLTQTVTVPAGFRGSMVAHLGPTGAPQLSVFADDVTAVPPGTSRLVVRHTAAAQDVAVLLNAQAVFTDVAATTEGAEVVTAGPYEIEVTPLAGGAPLAAPQDVEYPDGTANFMYLIGSRVGGHARLGGGPGRRPRDRPGGDPDRRRQHRAQRRRGFRDRPTDRDDVGRDGGQRSPSSSGHDRGELPADPCRGGP